MASSPSCSSASAGYALAATAMALSGTLVLLSLCRASKPPNADRAAEEPPRLRSCLSSSSSSEKRKREKARRGSQKRVRFADDVVDNGAATEERRAMSLRTSSPTMGVVAVELRTSAMPANREALYRAMLRGRSMLRVSCSY